MAVPVEKTSDAVRQSLNQAAQPSTGDSLAKAENITAGVQPPSGSYAGTSIISQMPPADLKEAEKAQAITQKDYDSAHRDILLTLARFQVLTNSDNFLSHKLRAALNLIDEYDKQKSSVDQSTATGGLAPLTDTPLHKVDEIAIPATSSTTKDPEIQPENPLIPNDNVVINPNPVPPVPAVDVKENTPIKQDSKDKK